MQHNAHFYIKFWKKNPNPTPSWPQFVPRRLRRFDRPFRLLFHSTLTTGQQWAVCCPSLTRDSRHADTACCPARVTLGQDAIQVQAVPNYDQQVTIIGLKMKQYVLVYFWHTDTHLNPQTYIYVRLLLCTYIRYIMYILYTVILRRIYYLHSNIISTLFVKRDHMFEYNLK